MLLKCIGRERRGVILRNSCLRITNIISTMKLFGNWLLTSCIINLMHKT